MSEGAGILHWPSSAATQILAHLPGVNVLDRRANGAAGCTGGGVADDTAAFQAAVDEAQLLARALIIPAVAGGYSVDPIIITSPIRILGEHAQQSYDNTGLARTTTSVGSFLKSRSGGHILHYVVPATPLGSMINASIENIRFVGKGIDDAGRGDAIYYDDTLDHNDTANFVMRNVVWEDIPGWMFNQVAPTDAYTHANYNFHWSDLRGFRCANGMRIKGGPACMIDTLFLQAMGQGGVGLKLLGGYFYLDNCNFSVILSDQGNTIDHAPLSDTWTGDPYTAIDADCPFTVAHSTFEDIYGTYIKMRAGCTDAVVDRCRAMVVNYTRMPTSKILEWSDDNAGPTMRWYDSPIQATGTPPNGAHAHISAAVYSFFPKIFQTGTGTRQIPLIWRDHDGASATPPVFIQLDGAGAICNIGDNFNIFGDWKFVGQIGFNNAAPSGALSVTGSRGSNAALASLITQLAAKGLITDNTT